MRESYRHHATLPACSGCRNGSGAATRLYNGAALSASTRDTVPTASRTLATAWRLLAVAALLLAASLWLAATAQAAVSGDTPTYLLKSYTKVGQYRSFKCDIAADLSSPPQLVVFGGSRAMRFRPSDFFDATSLSSINAATQNFRPEDSWAIANYLIKRDPSADLHCFFAIQATTFSDAPLDPGLLYDRRLSRWFPETLVAQQKILAGTPRRPNLVANKRFSSRGLMLHNSYDDRRAAGVPLDHILDEYLRDLLPTAGDTTRVKQTRSRLYFEKTVKLFNGRGIVPVAVIMPYHPRVLAAFRAVGWEVKVDRLRKYLAALQTRCDLRVVDLLEIESFGGSPDEFYDGAHITMENSARIIRHVAGVVPECFAPTPVTSE